MSTERPDHDVSGPRRRRSPLAVASVAAAVLIAGGGGAYWAASAAGGEGGGASGGDRTPPPLSLGLAAGGPSAPSRGIAPGEPPPGGEGVVYRSSGELPEGPDSAAVHRSTGTVSAAEVARLARALDLDGTPTAQGTVWKVGTDKDGSGPILRVGRQAPGSWTFARYGSGGPDRCASPAVCASGTAGGGAPGQVAPVGEKAAEAAAAPVLKALGQEDAALDAAQVMGSVRVVNADPVVGGLPTYGWATGIQVGADGEVAGGSGQLKSLEKGDTYPVTGAAEALKRLNASSKGGGTPDVGGCATPVPLEGGQPVPPADCPMPRGAGKPTLMRVDKAVFGLATQYVDGKQALVPSWLFSVRPATGGPVSTVSQVAVDPAHLTEPEEPGTEAGERRVTSYGADGRTLTVTFWGGVCSAYAAHAEESAGEVRVSVTERPRESKKVCVLVAKELKRTVTLDEPVGDRRIVDAASGAAVPRA